MAFLLVLSLLFLSSSASLVNLHVKRVIDVSGTLSISRTTIRMKNIADQPASFFYLSLKSTDAAGLGDLWVSDSSRKPLTSLHMEPSTEVPGLEDCCTGFKVHLREPLPVGGEVSVDVRMDVADVVTPVPPVLQGKEVQFMRFVGNAYFFTPYETKEMITSMTLGSSTVTSKNGLIEPYDLEGSKLTMGPYKSVPALSFSEISIRFKNDRGFLVADKSIKEFYVNHLGNIAAREEYHVVNDGARHEGEWSRVDHSGSYSSKYGTALGDVWANLPADATRVSYEDLIGNVTSSRLRKPTKGKRAVQLTYRYPLMGGWRNHFWISYEMSLRKYVHSKGSKHVIEVPIFPSLDTDLLSREFEIKVYLPEWSHSIEMQEHPSLDLSVDKSSERTTLTMYGRPVVTVRGKMTRSQSKHSKTLTIAYAYNPLCTYIIPALIAVEIISLLIGFTLCARSGLRLKAGDGHSITKLKAQ